MLPRTLLALFFLSCLWLEIRPKSPRAPSPASTAQHAVKQSLPDRLLMAALNPGARKMMLEKAEMPALGTSR
jgi:hypothetical protein